MQDTQGMLWSACEQVQDAVREWARSGQDAYPSYVTRNTRLSILWDEYIKQNPGILR